MTRRKGTRSLLSASALVALQVLGNETEIAEKLVFRESFDAALGPARGNARLIASPNPVTYVAGVVREAAFLGKGPVVYRQSGYWEGKNGSVAFWLKPARKIQDLTDDAAVIFSGSNVRLSYTAGKRKLFFMTGKLFPRSGYEWDYGCWTDAPQKWDTKAWRHIAFTWNGATGVKKLFIDGKMVRGENTNVISEASRYAELSLGRENFPACFDEWMVWDRELSDEEVATLYENPVAIAQAVAAGKKRGPSTKECPLAFPIRKFERPAESIVLPGATFRFAAPVKNIGETAFSGPLRVELVDFWGKVRSRRDVPLTLAPGEAKDMALSFQTPNEKGAFKIAVTVPAGGTTFVRDVTSFAAWPTPRGKPDPDSFFGNHINSFDAVHHRFIEQAARLGQGWQRTHDMLQCTWWNRVQPEPGAFKWTLDALYEEYKKRNMPVLGALMGTPYWAVRDRSLVAGRGKGGPRGYSAPPDPELWRRYVEETVNHYKDYIKYWEVYNEPEVSGFWSGSPAELAELNKIAYEAVKKVDPTAKVLTAGYTYPSWRWHEEHAKAGALKYTDIISVHMMFDMDAREELRENMAHWRRLAKKYAGSALPIWSTESGYGDTTWLRGLGLPDLPPENERQPISADAGAFGVTRASAMLQAAGVEKHFIYWQGPAPSGPAAYANGSMLDVNDAPRPKLIARVAMAEQLDPCVYKAQVDRPAAAGFQAMVYERKDRSGSVVLWWCGTGGDIAIAVPWPGKVETAVDIMGNAFDFAAPAIVTEAPYYVNVAAPAETVREALAAAAITVIAKPIETAKAPVDAKPDVPYLPTYVVPSENVAGVFAVDLRPYCNMGFADDRPGDGVGGWTDEGAMNDMGEFPLGKQTFYGVPFDIIDPAKNKGKSVVTLRSSIITPTRPDKVTIPVNRKNVRCLYFLHAAGWGKPGKIGAYAVHYSDGSARTIENKIPRNNGNWWNGYHPTGEISKPVPIRTTRTMTGKPTWRYVRVFEWENPWPEKQIKAIDVTSRGGPQAPILIAISGVTR